MQNNVAVTGGKHDSRGRHGTLCRICKHRKLIPPEAGRSTRDFSHNGKISRGSMADECQELGVVRMAKAAGARCQATDISSGVFCLEFSGLPRAVVGK